MSNTPDPTIAVVATLASISGQLDILVERGAELTPRASANADWTPSEILGHLCDSARYWGARMYRVAHEDVPELPFFDENDMVQLAAYRYRPLAPLLRQFHLIAEDNIALLRSLPTEAWDRTGRHATRGRITLREIATVEADHEQNHVRQLRAALGLAGSSRAAGWPLSPPPLPQCAPQAEIRRRDSDGRRCGGVMLVA